MQRAYQSPRCIANEAGWVVALLKQVALLGTLSIEALRARVVSSAVAVVGFAVTAAVLTAVLIFSKCFATLWSLGGSPEVGVVMARSAFNELTSRIPQGALGALSQIATNEGTSASRISGQLLVAVTIPSQSDGRDVSVPVRGVGGGFKETDRGFVITTGRSFRLGVYEAIVGQRLVAALPGLRIGGSIRIGTTSFRIVGEFDDSGGLHESEVWTDIHELQAASGENGQLSAVYVRLAHSSDFTSFAKHVLALPSFALVAARQTAYLRKQGSFYRKVILGPGLGIVAVMGVAALLAALNTIHSVTQSRLREIGTLRAIGFVPGAIILQVILEAALLGCFGALIGSCAAILLLGNATTLAPNGWYQIAVTMAATGSEVSEVVSFIVGLAVVSGIGPAIVATRVAVAAQLSAKV